MKNIAYIDHQFREILNAITILDMLLSEKDIGSQSRNKVQITRDLLTDMLNETNYFIQQIIAQEEEIYMMKNEFNTHINHELKTPLTSILGTTDFLLNYHNSLSKDDFVPRIERIKSSSEELLSLVHELLNLSRLESGKYPFRLDHIHIEEILEHMEKHFIPLFQDKSIAFQSIFIPHKNFSNFINDPNHIYQILSNLLSNALKFTEKGKVTLYIHNKNKRILFTVKDTGTGINKKQIRAILTDSKDPHKDPTDNSIGFYIIKRLLKLHGGDLYITSQINTGSECSVSLPLRSKLCDKEKAAQ